ncbi:alpha/beta hydrolase [Chromatiales bacterium (ex Bugula neritina AB1)]|nr:alpha/beta hydrolase [Chromatiales bacterium (ex Bugula neritina AB1)]
MTLKTVNAGVLRIAYYESGPVNGEVIILLHGFPYDTHAYDQVVAVLADSGFRCIVPYLRGYGPTEFLSDKTMRSGQQAALGVDLLSLMDALDISQAVLGGYDWGGRAACIVAALWPHRVRGLVSCGQGYNIQNIALAADPASPEEEHRYWYQYYFHTARGREGLRRNRGALCQFIWTLWSPLWKFDQSVFDQSVTSFENPDFVDIVIHSYRHRFGGIDGDPALDEIESQLARQPGISVPAVVLQGEADAVDPPQFEDVDVARFSGFYQRRVIPGVGHNFPQEAPQIFVEALREVAAQ